MSSSNNQMEEEKNINDDMESENQDISVDELEKKLIEDPNSLEIILLLLDHYSKNNEKAKLSNLRQIAQKKCMLPESIDLNLKLVILILFADIWLEWLDEELKKANLTESKKDTLKLFQKALEDFDCFISFHFFF